MYCRVYTPTLWVGLLSAQTHPFGGTLRLRLCGSVKSPIHCDFCSQHLRLCHRHGMGDGYRGEKIVMRKSPLPSRPLVALGPPLDADGLRPVPLEPASCRFPLPVSSQLAALTLTSQSYRTGLAVEWLDAHALVWGAATVFLDARNDARFFFVHDAALDLLFYPCGAAGFE